MSSRGYIYVYIQGYIGIYDIWDLGFRVQVSYELDKEPMSINYLGDIDFSSYESLGSRVKGRSMDTWFRV